MLKAKLNPNAQVVDEPYTVEDEAGSVRLAKIKTYGDVTHTLIDRSEYSASLHLPGYQKSENQKNYRIDPVFSNLAGTGLDFVDHCVGNQPWDAMEPTTKWYEDTLLFHRFWSVDDSVMHTDYSALR